MKKSLSLIVAIAMVFSMFATVVASAAEETKLTTEQKYEALVKAGIFEGFPNGEAKLDENMERSQAAKIVSLLLGYEEGVEVKDAGFKDVDVKGQRWAIDVINYAAELGILEGHSATRFGPADNVTVEELAQIVVRVIEFAGQELPAGEAVEGKVSKWAEEVVASVVSAGIIPALDDYTVAATRGQLVEVTYPLYELTKEPEFGATQTGAKQVTVHFGDAVDPAKVDFEIKNALVNREVEDANYADDKKSVVIDLKTKLIDGASTVTIKGVDKEDLVAEFTAQAEKIVEIKFNSDKLAFVAADNFKQVTTSYAVLNQFGEDVSKTVGSIQFQVGKSSVSTQTRDGILTITSTNDFAYNETIYVTAVLNMNTYVVTESQAFTVSAAAHVDTVKILSVYNKDGKTLTNANANEFVLLLEATDQYGNKISADKFKAKGQVFANVNNPTLFDLDMDSVGDEYGPNANQLGIKLKNGLDSGYVIEGNNKVTVTATYSGKSDSIDVPVKKASTLTTIKLSPPTDSIAIGDKDVVIPFQAFDQDGNQIKKFADLSKLNVTGTGGTGIVLKPNYATKEGVIVIGEVTSSIVYITAHVENTPNSDQLRIDAGDKAVADTVTGFKKDFSTTALVGNDITIKPGNIAIADQFGRSIDVKLGNLENEYNIVLTAGTLTKTFNGTANEALVVPGTEKAEFKFTIELFVIVEDANNALVQKSVSSKDAKVNIVDSGAVNYDSVEVKFPEKLFAGDLEGAGSTVTEADQQGTALEVTAKTKDGKSVKLAPTAYSVLVGSGLEIGTDGKVYSTDASSDDLKTFITVSVFGSEFTKTIPVNVVKEARVPVSFKQENKTGITSKDLVVEGAASLVKDIDTVLGTIVITDQYGKTLAEDPAKIQVSVSSLEDVNKVAGSEFTLGNLPGMSALLSNVGDVTTAGSINSALKNMAVGDSYSVTFASTTSGKSISLKVVANAN